MSESVGIGSPEWGWEHTKILSCWFAQARDWSG